MQYILPTCDEAIHYSKSVKLYEISTILSIFMGFYYFILCFIIFFLMQALLHLNSFNRAISCGFSGVAFIVLCNYEVRNDFI